MANALVLCFFYANRRRRRAHLLGTSFSSNLSKVSLPFERHVISENRNFIIIVLEYLYQDGRFFKTSMSVLLSQLGKKISKLDQIYIDIYLFIAWVTTLQVRCNEGH